MKLSKGKEVRFIFNPIPTIALTQSLPLVLFSIKIPEIFRGFGKGIREFKEASKEIKKEIEKDSSEDKK